MLGITFRASENRMWITSSYLRYENKAILILRILSQIEVPQNAVTNRSSSKCKVPLREANAWCFSKTVEYATQIQNNTHRKDSLPFKTLNTYYNTPKTSNAKHISHSLKLAINIIVILFTANLRGLEMCFAMFVLKHPGNCSFPLCNSSDFQLWLELLSVFLISKKNCNQTVYSITIFIFQPLWLKVQNSTISIFFFFFGGGDSILNSLHTCLLDYFESKHILQQRWATKYLSSITKCRKHLYFGA